MSEVTTLFVFIWVHLAQDLTEVCVYAVQQTQVPQVHPRQRAWRPRRNTRDDEGLPNNLNVVDFETAWNSKYMCNVRKQMLNGENPSVASVL